MKIINTNEDYGDMGPFEAESFEALADEMKPNFEEWAYEEAMEEGDSMDDILSGGYEEIVTRMRIEFIAGLRVAD